MQIKKWKLILLIIPIILIGIKINMNVTNNDTLKITLVMQPKSTDPLDYDSSIHHNTMRSIYASLVSNYKKGEITPQIATKWEALDNHKIWKLDISKDWKFQSGLHVTPQIVVKSLKRVLKIKNQMDSKSGLLEYLIDSDKIINIDDDIRGLQFNENQVIFNFKKPMPDFLEKISFGLYAIVSPEDYDKQGNWKNKKKINASGLYSIKEWDDKKFVINARIKDFHDKFSDNSIKEIIFIYPDDLSKIENSKMVFSDRLNNRINDEEWNFASSSLDNKMFYIQVMKWELKDSIYSKKEFRKKLRYQFYKSLQASGMPIVKSFFPLSITGVKELKLNSEELLDFKGNEIATQPFGTTNYKAENLKKAQADYFAEAFFGLCERVNAKSAIHDYPEKESDEKKVFDLQFLGTGISVDEPFEDIRFMFKSKHGIQLPDENGIIHKKIGSNFSIQEINEELWEQAIIWPIKHYSSGFWYKKDGHLDISELNILLTPMDFQFLKWKK